MLKRLWLLVAILVLALGNSSIGMAQWSGMELPATTGPYGVGTVIKSMADGGRHGEYTDGSSSEQREFMTKIWYPTDKGVDGPKSPYTDELTAEYLLKTNNTPGVDKNIRFQIKTHGVVGASVATGTERFPVVIFSPGFGTSYFLYQSILEELASYGYIVVGVNSSNSAGITAFPDGHSHVIPTIGENEAEAYLAQHFQEVADDLQFVVKQLSLLDSDTSLPLATRVDFGRVACFGHSYGGAAAVQASIQNLQLSAAGNLDGSLYGEGYKKTISKPMLMVWSEDGDASKDEVWRNLSKGSYQVQITGIDHMSFSDYLLIAKAMGISAAQNPNPMDPLRALQISRDTLRSFFDIHLKRGNPSQMNKIAGKYHEVKLEEKSTGKSK